MGKLKLGREEWLMKAVQAVYKCTVNKIRVNHEYSDKFNVQVGVQQGAVFNLLFIIIFQTITEELKTGGPWELLYAMI